MRASRALLAVNGLCFVTTAWLYGTDAADYLRARTAAASALAELPRVWFAAPVLAAALGCAGVVVYGVAKGRGNAFRGYRMLPILLVVALFVDVFALGEARLPLSTADQSAISLHLLARSLSALSRGGVVPSDAAEVDPVVQAMGPPPYLEHGVRPEHFALQIRQKCRGPVDDAPGARVGTFLYCVSADRRQGWLTLIGLPAEQRFGDPRAFSRGGAVQVTTVQPPSEQPAAGAPDEGSVPFARDPEGALTPGNPGR